MTTQALNYFFITGCYRSGTTLIDKYLGSHPDCVAFSQPMTSLFLRAKEGFYEKIGNPSKRYLGLGSPPEYQIDDFNLFLNFPDVNDEIRNLIMDTLSNVCGLPRISVASAELSNLDFAALYCHLLKLMHSGLGREASAVGVKEILCQEYIPYFIANNIKVVVIIRDPRNVIESLNFGKGKEFTGGIRPTLLNLHNWREVVDFVLRYKDFPNLFFFRYEDFILDSDLRMRLLSFLNLEPYNIDLNFLKESQGTYWKPNSSFAERSRNRLDQYVTSYVESVCFSEMRKLGYKTSISAEEIPAIIEGYREPWPIEPRPYYDIDYSTRREAVDYEIKRYLSRDNQGAPLR